MRDQFAKALIVRIYLSYGIMLTLESQRTLFRVMELFTEREIISINEEDYREIKNLLIETIERILNADKNVQEFLNEDEKIKTEDLLTAAAGAC